jgi:hypothetical protein
VCDLHWCIITKGVETKCAWLTLEQNHKGLNKVFTYKRYTYISKKLTMQGWHFIDNTHLREVVHNFKVNYNCCACVIPLYTKTTYLHSSHLQISNSSCFSLGLSPFLNTCLFNFIVYQGLLLLLILMNLMHLHQEANQLHTFKVHPTLDQVLLPSPLAHPNLVLAFQHSPLMCPTLQLFHPMHVLASLHSPLRSKCTQRSHKRYFTLILHVFFHKIILSYEWFFLQLVMKYDCNCPNKSKKIIILNKYEFVKMYILFAHFMFHLEKWW